MAEARTIYKAIPVTRWKVVRETIMEDGSVGAREDVGEGLYASEDFAGAVAACLQEEADAAAPVHDGGEEKHG